MRNDKDLGVVEIKWNFGEDRAKVHSSLELNMSSFLTELPQRHSHRLKRSR